MTIKSNDMGLRLILSFIQPQKVFTKSGKKGALKGDGLSFLSLGFLPLKSNKFILWIYALVVIMCSGILLAQSPLIEIEASVDRNNITIGERVKYSLKISRGNQLVVKDPGKGTNLGLFEIKDYKVYQPVINGSRIIEQFEYTIAAYDTGRQVIPPFPIAFLTSDTSKKYQFITSEPLQIYVRSMLDSPDAEIRDIRSPFAIPTDTLKLLLIISSIFVIAALIGIGYWVYKKRKEGKPVFGKEIIRPAHEIALEALEQLVSSDLLANNLQKEFFTELSDIIRRYIEGRFYIKAMEETTTEIMQSFKSGEYDSLATQYVQNALNNCDMVKFAKYLPGAKGANSTVEWTKMFIEQTKLEFQAVESEYSINR